VKFF